MATIMKKNLFYYNSPVRFGDRYMAKH